MASRFTRFCDWDERPSRWRNYPGVARGPENRPENGSSHVLRGSGEKIAAGICFKSTDSGACRPLSVYTDSLELLYSGLFLAGRVFMAPGEVRVSVPKCRIELVHRLLEKSLVITQPGFSGFD